MSFVAIYTIGRLKHSLEHPSTSEFFEIGYKVMRQADVSGHLVKEFSPLGVPFPEDLIKGDGTPILTLTVWKSLESLYRFTYSGQHQRALRNRHQWFDTHQGKRPSYVVWWTEEVADVSWEEAYKRYTYYLQHGSTSYAFDYKLAFDQAGERFLFK